MREVLRSNAFAATMFAASVFIGMETGGYQYIVLKVAEEYHLSQSSMGLLISTHFIAATMMPPLVGPVSDRIGKKKITILGCLFFLTGALVCCFVHSPAGFAAGIFGAGAAFGTLLTTCQAALSDAHPGEAGKYVSLFQGTLGIGCVAIPLLLSALMSQGGFTWRIQFAVCGAGFLLVMIAVLFVSFPVMGEGASSSAGKLDGEKPGEDLRQAETRGFRGLLTRFLIGTLAGILLYMFCETTLTFFMDSFFTLIFEAPGSSAAALSVFWAALAFIRLVASRFYQHAAIIVPALMLISAAIMIAFALNQSPLAAIVLAGLAGLSFGPIWPFLLGVATDAYPDRTGTVTGLVMLMDGGGGALAPFLIGVLSDGMGLRVAFGIVGILMLIAMVCFVTMVKRRETAAA